MQRKLRLVLPVVVVLLAIPAATAKAVARMPVGFFDDPSFRWAADPTDEPRLGAAGERIDHPRARQLVDDRADEAGERAQRQRSRLPPLGPRRARPLGAAVRHARCC